MKYLAIILVNTIVYFVLCLTAFLLTTVLSGSDAGEREFLSVSPLTLAVVASLPVASLHGLLIGGAIAFWNDRLSERILVGAAILALFANVLTAFWWLFLFLQLGEQPTPMATARGVVTAIVLTAISFVANLITLQLVRMRQTAEPSIKGSAVS